jgi:hypothetical protein
VEQLVQQVLLEPLGLKVKLVLQVLLVLWDPLEHLEQLVQ